MKLSRLGTTRPGRFPYCPGATGAGDAEFFAVRGPESGVVLSHELSHPPWKRSPRLGPTPQPTSVRPGAPAQHPLDPYVDDNPEQQPEESVDEMMERGLDAGSID